MTGVRLASRDLTLRLLAQVPLPKVASVHYFGIFAPAAKQRAEVVPARGGRVAHNKRKGKRKTGANVAAAPEHSGPKPPGDGGEPFKLVGAAAVAYGEIEIENEYSTKLTWAQCLRRAFAIRGPPGGLVPAEDQPDDDWDGWDEPPPRDWAA